MSALDLGIQPDGTALVALTVFDPAQAARLVAEYGELPEPLLAGRSQYYRAPAALLRDVPPGGIFVGGVLIRSASAAEVEAREVADMPTAWLSALVTFGMQIAARAERWPARGQQAIGKVWA